MIIGSFVWDDGNVEHIAKHKVEPQEVEEVFEPGFYLRKSWSGRYLVLGRTAAGRYLTCVFERGKQPGSIRIITAREMSSGEQKFYRRWR